MLVSFAYRFRNSIIEKIDPRTRWIFSVLVLFAIVRYWDIRFLSFFFVLVMIQFVLAKVTWKETRRAWIFMLVLVSVMTTVNVFITSGGIRDKWFIPGRTLWEWNTVLPFVGWKINYTMSNGRLWYALTQFIRIMSISGLFIIIPFTIDPRVYGITFSGFGDRFAFSLDLAFRFVPTLARDFTITMDAQRARGYEIEKADGGLFAQIRKVAPLMVPITMNAILSGEDITNAMDLRCFGLRKRTWLKELKYQWYDYAIIASGVVILVGTYIIYYGFHLGNFWLPTWLM